ncbi:hypothetical protein TSAR_010517, partial [Trichomalopsis sarcophagae]
MALNIYAEIDCYVPRYGIPVIKTRYHGTVGMTTKNHYPRAHFQPVLQHERINRQIASSTSGFQTNDTIKKCLEQGDVEDVQGVLARDGREELATKNNTAVLLSAREVEVMKGDVKIVDFAEPKVNLAMPDEVSDSTDRGFAASEESSLGRAMFRRSSAENVLPPKEPRIRDIKQRIFDRLATVNDGPELQRILTLVEGMLKEGLTVW